MHRAVSDATVHTVLSQSVRLRFRNEMYTEVFVAEIMFGVHFKIIVLELGVINGSIVDIS